jgi:CheY-like chemotaxis protein
MVRIDFNRLRFLVIDDNAHMRRILRTLLHGFGARESTKRKTARQAWKRSPTTFRTLSSPTGRCRFSTDSS